MSVRDDKVKYSKFWISLLSILSLFMFSTLSYAYVYEVVSLGNFGGYLGSTPVQDFASGINNKGQVVGTSYDVNGNAQPFIWENGRMTSIGSLGGLNGQAYDINNSGQVVGWSEDSIGRPSAFLWQSGTISNIGFSGGTESYARSINDQGNIVGNVYYDYGRGGIDVLLYSNGQVSNLGAGWANTINNSNQVLINSSIIWDNGIKSYLNLSGSVNISDSSMNNLGQVALQLNNQAIIWQNGITINIGTLGGNWSGVGSINNQGVVVGTSNYFVDGNDRAFIFQSGVIYDLNSLIPASSGWTIVSASDINEFGQIAAYARSPDGKYGAVLLNPVPIPSAIWLFLSGSIGIIALQKCKKNNEKKI
jgi:probable HAF family extracellular repeat protein